MTGVSGWSDQAVRRAAWATWLFHLAVLVQGLVLMLAIPETTATASWGSSGLALSVAFELLVFSFPSVGLVIVHRKPRNQMGWLLLLGVGMAASVPSLVFDYAVYALLIQPGALSGGAAATAVIEGSWVWWTGSVVIFVILLFPDGRLPSPRWRWLPLTALATMTLVAACISLGTETLTEGPVDELANPLFVERLDQPTLLALQGALPLIPAGSVAAAIALALRFRRSRGIERQQIKWLAEAGILVATCYLAAMVGQLLTSDHFASADPTWLIVLQDLALASFGLLPLAIGVAILRHRLYDIDRILNRTVVYAALTAALVGTYLASVLLFRLLLDPWVGRSDLAVAGSTLAVAALFRPVRSGIQGLVDRRFYRHSYDAAQSVEAFTGRLRQEVDLDAVDADLRGVLRDTVEPTHVSLWLRSSA